MPRCRWRQKRHIGDAQVSFVTLKIIHFIESFQLGAIIIMDCQKRAEKMTDLFFLCVLDDYLGNVEKRSLKLRILDLKFTSFFSRFDFILTLGKKVIFHENKRTTLMMIIETNLPITKFCKITFLTNINYSWEIRTDFPNSLDYFLFRVTCFFNEKASY
jgi:hypothetical protein